MKSILSISKTILSMMIVLGSVESAAQEGTIHFKNGALLEFSSRLTKQEAKNLGSGWKAAKYVSPSGSEFAVFPDERLDASEGVVFDAAYAPTVSPSGRYAMLDVLRVGELGQAASEKPVWVSRQYCPILDTQTGCVLSNESGEVCGGQWDRAHDRWMVGPDDDRSDVMLGYQFETANASWLEYKRGYTGVSIKSIVASNLGVNNMMLCDPVKNGNVEAYRDISAELKKVRQEKDAADIDRALEKFSASRVAER